MKIYRVKSGWSTELIAAKTIPEAIKKYEVSLKKIEKDDPELCEIKSIELIGDAR